MSQWDYLLLLTSHTFKRSTFQLKNLIMIFLDINTRIITADGLILKYMSHFQVCWCCQCVYNILQFWRRDSLYHEHNYTNYFIKSGHILLYCSPIAVVSGIMHMIYGCKKLFKGMLFLY